MEERLRGLTAQSSIRRLQMCDGLIQDDVTSNHEKRNATGERATSTGCVANNIICVIFHSGRIQAFFFICLYAWNLNFNVTKFIINVLLRPGIHASLQCCVNVLPGVAQPARIPEPQAVYPALAAFLLPQCDWWTLLIIYNWNNFVK